MPKFGNTRRFFKISAKSYFQVCAQQLVFSLFWKDVIFQLESVIVKLEILNSDKNEDVETGNWARKRWREGERGGRREVSRERESERARESERVRERARERERGQRERRGQRGRGGETSFPW